MLTAIAPDMTGADGEERFEFGLDVLIAGLEAASAADKAGRQQSLRRRWRLAETVGQVRWAALRVLQRPTYESAHAPVPAQAPHRGTWVYQRRTRGSPMIASCQAPYARCVLIATA